MREFLVIIIAVAIGFLLYSLYFNPDSRTPDEASAPANTPLPVTRVLGVGAETGLVVGGNSITVGIGLVSDSRCPKGVQCIRAGEGVVVVWAETGGAGRTESKLQTTDKGFTRIGPVAARIVSLEPYPESGKTIGRNEYRVTLEITSVAKSQKADS